MPSSGHPATHGLFWQIIEDRPVVSHQCQSEAFDGIALLVVVATLPYPTWQIIGDPPRVEPSFHCTACGCHAFLDESNRLPRGEATDG